MNEMSKIAVNIISLIIDKIDVGTLTLVCDELDSMLKEHENKILRIVKLEKFRQEVFEEKINELINMIERRNKQKGGENDEQD